MLLKPSAALYEEGVGVLQRCVFNRTVGWDHVGRPSTLSVRPLALVNGADRLASLQESHW